MVYRVVVSFVWLLLPFPSDDSNSRSDSRHEESHEGSKLTSLRENMLIVSLLEQVGFVDGLSELVVISSGMDFPGFDL